MKSPRRKTLTKTELAAIFGVRPETIIAWQSDGLPIKRKGGPGCASQYDPLDVLRWHGKRSQNPRHELDAERANLAKLQAETAGLRNAKLAGESIALEAAQSVAARAAFAIRQKILASRLTQQEKHGLLVEIHSLGETDFSSAEDALAEEETDDIEAAKPTG
jgi:phage terminase Nu1 subunit (DNA packaging protein)